MSAKPSPRTFAARPAVREQVPLLIGIVGPSGSGKTWSALRLATGIQRVVGGKVFGIDTEARRMLQYSDYFKFEHVEFGPPFGSDDYLAALRFCVDQGAKVVIVDQISSEHDGPGGLVDAQEKELDRMAGDNFEKRERCKMLAWVKPKAARRRLISGILQLNCNFIFNFRAKSISKPVKANGKTEVIPQGFVPIAGDEFIYEMTTNILLLPKSGGVPTWSSDNPGEAMAMKLPQQFVDIFAQRQPLSEDIGQRLAEWAAGKPAGTSPPPPPPSQPAQPAGQSLKDRVQGLLARYDVCQAREDFEGLEKERAALWGELNANGKQKLKAASEAASKRVDEAVEARIDSLAGQAPPEDDDQDEPDDDGGPPAGLFGGGTTQEQMDSLRR
jgi:hypothetical protein